VVLCRRDYATLQRSFDELGDGKDSIRAVSIDMSGGYEKAIREQVRDAEIAFDPFDACRLASRTTTRSAATNVTPTSAPTRVHRPLDQEHPQVAAQGTREPDDRPARPARRGPAGQTARSPARSCWVRTPAALPPARPRARARPLGGWLAWAGRSRLRPFIRLPKIIRSDREGILTAIRLGLCTRRLEGLNSRIRLVSTAASASTPPIPDRTSAVPASSSTSRGEPHPKPTGAPVRRHVGAG